MRDVELKNKKVVKKIKQIDLDIINQITVQVNEQYYVPVMISLLTSLRQGEVLGLRWEDIDLKKDIINVTYQLQYKNKQLVLCDLKTESSYRQIKMTNTLKDILLNAKNKYGQWNTN